jgi:putative ubiquitin-RnfH superfamily antitoxin RatB of RatAB toxin-antitoxin module
LSSSEAAVEVVFARPDRQRIVRVPLRAGMTAQEAVAASGLAREFPEIAAQPLLLGIYGCRIEDAHPLRDGDRVEIYRPLNFDPRDARRKAAQAARAGTQPRSPSRRRA